MRLIIFKILFFLIVITNVEKLSYAQNRTLDSLLTLIKNDKEDTSNVIHLNKLCKEYQQIDSHATALNYGNAALQLAKQLNFKKGITTAFNNIGIIYDKLGDYDKALENYFASLKLGEELGDKKNITNSYNNIGNIYYSMGNYYLALVYYQKSLKIDEETNDLNGIATGYTNLGVIYGEQNNFPKALENFRHAVRVFERLNNKKGIAACYSNLGNIFINQGLFKQGIEHYQKSLNIFQEIDDSWGVASCFINIGDVYVEQNNYTEAIIYYLKSLKIFEKSGDKKGMAIVYTNIAMWQNKLKQYNKGIEYATKGLQIALEINALPQKNDAYLHLKEAYSGLGNYKKAMEYTDLYIDVKDSLSNKEKNKQILEIQTKYETEKKEKENKILVQQNLLQQTIIEKRTFVLIILVGSLVFTIIIFVLLYNRYKLKQKALMEKEINLQQKFHFKAIIDAEEKERRRIAKELHDGLGQLLSTVKLNVSATEFFIDEPGKKLLTNSLSLIDSAVGEVRTISHNMMPNALIQLGILPALHELARKINVSKQLLVKIEANFDERFNESTEVNIYRIAQEVLNNIIKHSQANVVVLRLNRSEDNFLMQITDDGIGFDTSLIDKSEGIGWKNIYSRSAMLNGTVKIISAPSEGMTINIYFPNLFSDK